MIKQRQEPRILVGSVIRQRKEVLELFLSSLHNLKGDKTLIDYLLIIDDEFTDIKSPIETFRRNLRRSKSSLKIINIDPVKDGASNYNPSEHEWLPATVSRVAKFKNRILRYAASRNYDALLLIDSDLLIDPNLVNHLFFTVNKDICATIFWTKWPRATVKYPNAWLYNDYDLADPILGEDEKLIEQEKFLDMLKSPGSYKVGGTGACTLISKKVLQVPYINFDPIYNLSLWGEDRWFCVRAIVFGFDIFIDTQLPAYHVYYDEDIPNGENYINSFNSIN